MKLDPRLLREARAVRWYLALTIGAGFLAGILTVLQARYLSRIVDRVFLKEAALAEVAPYLALLLVIIAGRALAVWGSEASGYLAAARVKSALRTRLFAHIIALGPIYVSGERTGELSNAAMEGIEALEAYFRQYLPQLALAVLVPLTYLSFVLPRDAISGLVLLLTAPLIPIFMVLIGSLADALSKRQWETLSRLSAHFLDVLQGLTTLKLLGQSRAQARVIAAVTDRFRETTMGVLKVAFLSALVLELVATLSTAVVAVEIGLRLLYGRMDFERAFFVLLLAPEFYIPLRMLGTRFHAAVDGVTAAARIFKILETHPRVTAPPAIRSRRTPQRFHIRFEDVHCAYEEERAPALEGVSFHIPHGKRVALVGPSGSGKTTVAYLLLRFIEPSRGRITVDGIPLADLSIADWRRWVAWVPQHPYLFHETIAANIRLGRPHASMEEVIQAARLAHAHEFIQALPRGYETLVGERGARLSGGQAQRIALARAFLKDAPFLILDEASAHLDPEQEALIQDAMERLTRGRTVLIISHRLNTIYTADHIVVLRGGRVVESGSHEALLQREGLYRRLVTAHMAGRPT